MKFALTTAFLSLAGLVASANVDSRRVGCAEVDRFGDLTLTPSTFKPGDTLTVSVDLTCVQNFGLIPQFLDYSLVVFPPDNNGFDSENPVILARHAVAADAVSDLLVVQIPHAFFVAGAPYNLVVTNTHKINGSDGIPFLTSGLIASSVTITS